MKKDSRKIKGGRYLAIAVLLLFTVGANALNVVNTHTASNQQDNFFSVSSGANHSHRIKAPSGGNINSVVLKILGSDTTFFPQMTRHNGACASQTLYFDPSNGYCLRSIAVVNSGVGTACVNSLDVSSCVSCTGS